MKPIRPIVLLTIMILFLIHPGIIRAQKQEKGVELPGKYKNYTLLPNGWKLRPPGTEIPIGELPLNMVVTRDGNYAITSNSGMGINSLSVVDLNTMKEVQRLDVDNTWVGLAFGRNDKVLYVSGGNDNRVDVYNFESGRLRQNVSIKVGPKFPKGNISLTGLAYWKKKNRLLAVSQKSNMLYVIDIDKRKVLNEVDMGGKCYEVVINHAQTKAYVSLWGKSSVAEVNLSDLSIGHVFHTGDHPNQMVITKDDGRLFVANANNNSVSVLDLKNNRVMETLVTSLIPNAPYGSTPNGIALAHNDKQLLVANADNNYLAVFDVSKKEHARNTGFIPTGWYPTAVCYVPESNRIVVANGKGISSRANPDGPDPMKKRSADWMQNYTGTMFMGTVSVIPFPDAKKLALLSKEAYENTPYVHKKELAQNQHVIPLQHDGKTSPVIKHVFYIIRENRSYDQVLGDVKEGNGDPSLCLFGEKVTPNAHQLVKNFTLYDNFYVDAEVSADGHNWSTAAYATDYVEKLWPVNYGRRGASYDFEGGVPAAAPSSGYIWTNVLAHDKTYRNYGEFMKIGKIAKDGLYIPSNKDMYPYTDRRFPGFDLHFADLKRYEIWKHDFDSLIAINKLPDLTIMRLPNDHTMGTRPGALTPIAYVARNDFAMGKIVEHISKSKIWKESIIFVLEDDAQNGPDHVDAHRSVLLVIGPNVKRNFVDHTLYTTSGVLKTIELILGLPPMTQYDLSANPIVHSITDTANYSPYVAVLPTVNMMETNRKDAYGARLSKKLNFAREDAIPDGEFNKIIWKSVKGKNAVVPAPVHSAFVQERISKDDDD
ncbi:MAG: bifunctional YncE family protein/alkaline phosphatase family protein [Bacteroidales bacterium]|nr:bifunctional YncE family protein/alkaline phosphatase family protein [Bacteroidales bacterium]